MEEEQLLVHHLHLGGKTKDGRPKQTLHLHTNELVTADEMSKEVFEKTDKRKIKTLFSSRNFSLIVTSLRSLSYLSR